MRDVMTCEAEVLKLLSHVPSPPNEPIPAGATEREIVEFEERNGITLPIGLRSWLVTYNGPCVGPGGVFGIKTQRKSQDIEYILSLYPCWHEKGWIPVAGDGCGNYYLVITKGEFGEGEPVIFVDTMENDAVPAYIVASDIWRFLRFLFRRELGQSKWPFNRDEVLTLDPDILSFREITMPWNA